MQDDSIIEKEWWVSCTRFTCWVKTAGTKIIDAAPIAKKWTGQNFLRFLAYYSAERKELKYPCKRHPCTGEPIVGENV